jgi:methyl-accepting chemotaxis protein
MQEAAEAVRAISKNVLTISESINDVKRAVDTTKEAAPILAH